MVALVDSRKRGRADPHAGSGDREAARHSDRRADRGRDRAPETPADRRLSGGDHVVRVTSKDRVAIFGAQQSGKSKIALAISSRWPRFLGFDPKAEPWLLPPNTRVARSGREAAAALPGRVMYYPQAIDVGAQRKDFDIAMQRVLAIRGHGVVVHEGHALTETNHCPPSLNVCLWQGPAMEIPMVYCFQEPVRLWRPFFTQASVVIVTYLIDSHLAMLARELGAPAIAARPRPLDYSFLVWRRADPQRGIGESLIECPRLAA